MKVILDPKYRDLVVRYSLKTGIDAGDMPGKHVGLERIRHVEGKLIDIATLDELYVRYENGVFHLHAIPVKGSVLVSMTYADRKRLTINSSGDIELMTPAEKEVEEQATKDKLIDNKALRGDIKDFILGITRADVINHIDNVFSALNANQRASLKKLYCVVLFLAKDRIRQE